MKGLRQKKKGSAESNSLTASTRKWLNNGSRSYEPVIDRIGSNSGALLINHLLHFGTLKPLTVLLRIIPGWVALDYVAIG